MYWKWRLLRKVFYATVAMICTAIVLTIYVNDQISLAEVLVGSSPVVAARDLATLLKVQPDADGRPAGGETAITENTKCRLLRYESREWCPVGKGNPVKVELLEGPRRGQVVWVCSGQIRRLHPLP
jgi:hypothetical protein